MVTLAVGVACVRGRRRATSVAGVARRAKPGRGGRMRACWAQRAGLGRHAAATAGGGWPPSVVAGSVSPLDAELPHPGSERARREPQPGGGSVRPFDPPRDGFESCLDVPLLDRLERVT